MEIYNIGSICKQIRGVSYKPTDLHDDLNASSIILLRANNINEGEINLNDVVYVDKSKVKEEQILRQGDILICASSGSKDLVGKAASFYKNMECTFGAFCKVVRPNKEYEKYLSVFFQSSLYRKNISKASAGANINNIRNDDIDNLKINPISIQQQDVIFEKIQKCKKIITQRKEMLCNLDLLIKSRFVEMFGDPTTNIKNWEIVNMSDIVEGRVSNGFFAKRDDYINNGNVAVMGVANIVNRMYSDFSNLPRTNGTGNDIKKYEVKYGDMLFCRSSLVAEGIGKASIVSKNVPSNILFECHVIRVPLNLKKCVPEFMQVLSTTEYFRRQITAQANTATMTTIGQDGILKTKIVLPPKWLQNEFASFVEQVNKSKFAVQKSIDELQTLYDSLMQEYFG